MGERKPTSADADLGGDQPPSKQRADGLTYDRRKAVAHLREVDSDVARVMDAYGPFEIRPEPDLDPYPYLLRTIVFQQLHGAAAGAIHQRVLDLFGGAVPDPQDLLDMDATTLRTAGLSGNKTLAVHDLARHVIDGVVPTSEEVYGLSDIELVDRFTAVRGIGPWTVHMLLMFRLGRPDILPTGDFGVREGFRLMLGEDLQPTPAQLRARTEHWRPYRSVASWYMWRATDLWRAGELPTA